MSKVNGENQANCGENLFVARFAVCAAVAAVALRYKATNES